MRRRAAITASIAACALCAPALADDAPGDLNWLERQVNKRISHHERDLDWLQGDFNLWSGIASAAVIGVAIDRASNDSPFEGLGGQLGEKGPVVKLGDEIYTAILAWATSRPCWPGIIVASSTWDSTTWHPPV